MEDTAAILVCVDCEYLISESCLCYFQTIHGKNVAFSNTKNLHNRFYACHLAF